jgi:hypothetical protein
MPNSFTTRIATRLVAVKDAIGVALTTSGEFHDVFKAATSATNDTFMAIFKCIEQSTAAYDSMSALKFSLSNGGNKAGIEVYGAQFDVVVAAHQHAINTSNDTFFAWTQTFEITRANILTNRSSAKRIVHISATTKATSMSTMFTEVVEAAEETIAVTLKQRDAVFANHDAVRKIGTAISEYADYLSTAKDSLDVLRSDIPQADMDMDIIALDAVCTTCSAAKELSHIAHAAYMKTCELANSAYLASMTDFRVINNITDFIVAETICDFHNREQQGRDFPVILRHCERVVPGGGGDRSSSSGGTPHGADDIVDQCTLEKRTCANFF